MLQHTSDWSIDIGSPPLAPAEIPNDMIDDWLQDSLIVKEDWDQLPTATRDALRATADEAELLRKLVELRLVTQYQADRIEAGRTFGLILGNYRVLDRLGAGGMGVVFLAEHHFLRRRVAIKAMPMYRDDNSRQTLLRRFLNEIRLIAQLQHPNIIWAIDTGELRGTDPNDPNLHYLVMEYVPGKDLEDLVKSEGPMPYERACDVVYQIASALVETDKHQLVHRDIKPSNVLLTPEGQAKLLDFGLARRPASRSTQPGIVLGTVDYVAPEQVADATNVDIRADIYGLGGTLYWCLTGKPPFANNGSLHTLLTARLTQPPPSARSVQPAIPPALDEVVRRMMATDREDRYANPTAVMRCLLPFLRKEGHTPYLEDPSFDPSPQISLGDCSLTSARRRVLIVDDEASVRTYCSVILGAEGFNCIELSDGQRVLGTLQTTPCDVVLLDVQMPLMDGVEVLQMLRSAAPIPNLKVIMMSGRATTEEMSQMMMNGADDFLTKPLSVVQLKARASAAARLKHAQDRVEQLNQQLLGMNRHLEQNLEAQNCDLVESRNAVVLALAEFVTYRGLETAAHLERLRGYVRCLAETMAQMGGFGDQLDANFISILESAAPLHDIGMIGLPEHILFKPGKLDPEERMAVQTHTVIGAEILQKIAHRSHVTAPFLQVAIDITRHHHERWDGSGYPDRLKCKDIPLASRIVAVADVYDALRSRRPHKPALSHGAACQLVTEGSQGQFDPQILMAFQRCNERLERIWREFPD
ncbi:MAG TPA: HD domain-containing phosphohydrolase [Gemmataceae bacterium]|nr:HD domain-containing phosphohydrolase [Gemmataceae bacterium]